MRFSAAQPKNIPTQSSFIKYNPMEQSSAFNSGAKERTIRIVVIPVDPLDPPKSNHKRVPTASVSPPIPVMHSPPRPLTLKDQQHWKIPPCISNWKNPKGYTIPLDMRFAAAHEKGLEEVKVNDNFAKLSESLHVTTQMAREAVFMRSKIQKEMVIKDKERKEQELRALALKARTTSNQSGLNYEYSNEEREQCLERRKIREERHRERERERRLEGEDGGVRKKNKITRDIGEKVSLGMASFGGGIYHYDHRLFNKEKGLNSGFESDEQYNVYSKRLFTLEKSGLRHRPVESLKGFEEADVYGLDQFITEMKKGVHRLTGRTC